MLREWLQIIRNKDMAQKTNTTQSLHIISNVTAVSNQFIENLFRYESSLLITQQRWPSYDIYHHMEKPVFIRSQSILETVQSTYKFACYTELLFCKIRGLRIETSIYASCNQNYTVRTILRRMSIEPPPFLKWYIEQKNFKIIDEVLLDGVYQREINSLLADHVTPTLYFIFHQLLLRENNG